MLISQTHESCQRHHGMERVIWLESSSESGYKRRSTVTDTEDVSYVSSAYIPQCLRFGGRPTLSNAHRAHISGQAGIDNIRDNDLEEIVTLNSVSMIVAEYLGPTGNKDSEKVD